MSNLVTDLASDQPAAPAAPESPIAGTPPQVQLVLRGLSSGQIPGAFVPKDAPKIESGLTPEKLNDLGIGLYLPKDKTLAAVAFNHGKVSEKMLQKMDAAGTLTKNFPDITTLLEGTGDSGSAPASSDTAPDSSGAVADPTATIPVLPRPGLTGAGANSLANKRVNALSLDPSKRTIPGGGAVLNGLIDRPA